MPDEWGLDGNRFHVTDRELAGDRGSSTEPGDRRAQHLVQIRCDDPALRGAGRALVLSRDDDRRGNTLGRFEAADVETVRMAGAAPETLVEEILGSVGVPLLFQVPEIRVEDVRKLGLRPHTRSSFCSDRISRGGFSSDPNAVHDTSAT